MFTVIIALEFKRSLLVLAERGDTVVQVRTVILIAKLIILDLATTMPSICSRSRRPSSCSARSTGWCAIRTGASAPGGRRIEGMEPSSRHVVCPHCGAVNRIPTARPAAQAKCGQCHRPLFEGKPVAAGADALSSIRTHNDIPVVVDFWAELVRPLSGDGAGLRARRRRARARLPLPQGRYRGRARARRPLKIRSIPTTMLFARGQPVAQTAGAMNAAGIVAWVLAKQPE